MPTDDREKGSEIESISWADQEEGHQPDSEDDGVDLSRFGGDESEDDAHFGADELEPEGEDQHQPDDDFGDNLENLSEHETESVPFFKRKWFIFLALGLIVFGAFAFGIYKSMSRQPRKNAIFEQQVPAPPSVDVGLPMILPEEREQPKSELAAAEPTPAPPSPQAQAAEPVSQPSPPPALVAPENQSVAAENKDSRELRAYVDQHLASLRAVIAEDEVKHRAEYKKIASRLESISNDLKKRPTFSPAAGAAVHSPAISSPPPPQSMPGYRLQSIVPDRAWVVLPDESVKVVVVGTILPGGLRVEKIIANEQQVTTNKGIIK